MVSRSKFSQVMASVYINAVYAMENYPIMLVNTLLAPFSILIVITLVSHGELIQVGIEGALIMVTLSGGMSLQGDLSHLKNDMKLQDMVVSSPTSSFLYVVGMGISEIIYVSPVLLILAILSAVYIHPTLAQTAVIAAVIGIMFIFSITIGFLLSTFTSDVVQSWGFAGIVSTLLSTIPPVYYPISYIPQPLQYIAYISPTTYAAEIIQNAIGFISLTEANLIIDWVVIVLVCVVMLAVAYKKARWREP
jgi:ABC-2 type transport system permease protein